MRTLYCQGMFIGTRCPDNANDLAVTTQRNALPRLHLCRQLAKTGRNVIGHPASLYLSGTAWPGGYWGVIEHFPAPITDCSTTARGQLKHCVPATCVLQSRRRVGTLLCSGAPT